MSDYIERDKAIEAIAEHLMGEAMCDYPDASDNIEDWKEIGEAILENIPPAEVIPKGSDEASLAYAEGWKNGEEAERSRHKMNATGDLIERSEVLKQLWLNHKDVVYIDKNECARRIEAIPSARPNNRGICGVCAGRKVCSNNNRNLDMLECNMFELDEHYKISRPKGEWQMDEDDDIYHCSKCFFEIDASGCIDPTEYISIYNFCPNCGSDNREREGE